jgi:signal transduction histidine kinase
MLQRALYRISEAANSAQDMPALFALVHEIVGTLIVAENFYIALYDKMINSVSFPYFVDEYDPQPESRELGHGLTDYVIRNGVALLSSPKKFAAMQDAGQVELVGTYSGNWLGIPLKNAEGKVIGALVVQTYDSTADVSSYTQEDQDILEFVSTQIAMAIERKQAEATLRSREQFLAQLNEITSMALETLDSPTMLQTLAERLVEILGADGGFFALWDEATQQPFYPETDPSSMWHSSHEMLRLAPGVVSLTRTALGAQCSIIVEDILATPYLSNAIAERLPARSLLVLPLVAGEQNLGVVAIGFNTQHLFTPDELQRGEQAAQQIALAIAKARLVETLVQRRITLENRNAELDAFAHTVAHDLKNPLTALIGYSAVLEQRYDRTDVESVRSISHTIGRNGRRMVNIIDELLLLSSVRKLDDVKMGVLDMMMITAEAQARLTDMIANANAKIAIPSIWPDAIGYAPWIEEVWANYISNAIKYGGQPPYIELGATVEAESSTAEGGTSPNCVRFWVRDNGPGLTEAEQGQLFTEFTRLHQVRAEGHGLGLSIVQRIVEKLGGTVGVDSKIGHGSTFWFTLPLG